MIHVCYCFCDKTGRYAKFAGTSMFSLFDNTKLEVTVHLLHDDTLTQENRDKFSYIAGRYNQRVKFYNLSERCPEKIAEIVKLVPEVEKAAVTIGAFYKLLIPQVLPANIKKAVFIDPDTIVNLDINELWQIELGDKILGGVPEVSNGANPNKTFLLCSEGIVKGTDYFNCGVLLMNLELLRGEEEKIMQGIKFRGENPKQKFLEQTVLNYCFAGRTLHLPLEFNTFVRKDRSAEKPVAGRKIYHYAGNKSKMGLDMTDPFNLLWMNYFIKTPFFDEDSVGRLHISLQKIRNKSRDSALKISMILEGKARAFFVEPKKVDSIKKFFSIRNDEEIILAENEASIQKLIKSMQLSKGKCVYFILAEKILKKKFPFDKLRAAGFTEDKDFVKAWSFLVDIHDIPFNSYSLIEIM
ncbi:MAG: hypothetical protein IKO74_03720 [Selenomonadaceae bacterium]|nr:hypothetical protein [Selenomonadaceae bacterium]